ncbi:hypothetical protein EV127DRAFT_485687 [Xylaria flabelliformis]|nr:hypothetical protein EV127DRAFT_485687 [Xylaria flabelliformis]
MYYGVGGKYERPLLSLTAYHFLVACVMAAGARSHNTGSLDERAYGGEREAGRCRR